MKRNWERVCEERQINRTVRANWRLLINISARKCWNKEQAETYDWDK